MNHEPTTTNQSNAEPGAGSTAVPIWLIVFMVLLLFGGTIYFDANGGWFNSNVYAPYRDISEVENYQLPKTGNEVVLRGRQLFHANCELCHNADGMGKPGQAPPMAGSEWVNAEGVNRLIRIPQVGLNGPLTVKGQEWNLAMAPMGAAYSHEDLAAVLTYSRQSWGNQASAVTPDQVKAVRAAVAGHPMSYTVEELKSLPEK
jgi:mono/diheme cytochrome c family protein